MGVWCDMEGGWWMDGGGGGGIAFAGASASRPPASQPASHIKPATKSNYSHTQSTHREGISQAADHLCRKCIV
jgi:hypothetical protein